MNRPTFIVALILATSPCFAAAPDRPDYVLPSWGDIVYSYGPGVDPALDSPEAFQRMITHWKGRGFRGVLLRTDLAQLDPATYKRNVLKKQENPRLAVAWKYIDEVMERFDVHEVGNAISRKNDFEFWAWHAHMFSDGAPEDAGAPGPFRMWPWSYCANYTRENPDAVTTDRTQSKRYWMVREYGYPEARATKVAEFVYMAKKFGLRRFVVENRSEGSQMQDAPDHADRFGFNEIVVKDMKAKYGVDILTDARFDVDSPSFNTLDPMVENWHKLRGEYFTQFFRELRKAMDEIDPKIEIWASVAGERIGPPMGNWVTDWRTWVDEGLVDGIISPCDFDAYPTDAKFLKTYITCAKQGRGTLELSVFKEHIKKSKHPEVKLISGGSHFFPHPPTDGDGWRITDWYDSYHLAWYQRWAQLMRDLDEFGHIKFFQQSFDDFPVDSSYHAGGYGNKGYVPSLRACPGVWATMGPASDTLPSVQSKVRYGDRGNAVKFTKDPKRSTELSVSHSSTADRSSYYSCIEPAILNGKAEFDFRIHRDSDDSSLTVYFQDTYDAKQDIAVRIAGGKGEVFYSKSGTWIASGVTVPKQSWQQIRITVDFAKQAYSAALLGDQAGGGGGGKPICDAIPYMPPQRRFVANDDGSAGRVELKAHKMLNHLTFVPEGKDGNITYLDDVIVRWTPAIPNEKPASKVRFAENFERFPVGAHAVDQKPQTGKQWDINPAEVKHAVIEKDTSYGEGVHCLRLQGKTELGCALTEDPSAGIQKKLVLDVDLYVRSSAFYMAIMPSTPTETRHIANLALTDQQGKELIGLKNDNGKWACRDANGQYKQTEVPAALDCWNHIQISVDPAKATYKIVLQPVGEMPMILASGNIPSDQLANLKKFTIRTENLDDAYESKQGSGTSRINFSCIDNLSVTEE
jgi:hypothetical protein